MKAGRIATVILAAIAVMVLPLTAYVAAYLWLGQFFDWRGSLKDGPTGMIERNYNQLWQATIFKPAGSVEGLIRGTRVDVTYSEVPGPVDMPSP